MLERILRYLKKSAELMYQKCRRRADPDVGEVGRRNRVKPARSGDLPRHVPQINHDNCHHEVLEKGGEHRRLE